MSIIQDVKTLFGPTQPHFTKIKTAAQIKTILIVEDDPILQEMYNDKFTKVGFVVLTAANGQEGLEKTLSQKPDIILLDLMMPIMDGKVMLKKLREFPQF